MRMMCAAIMAAAMMATSVSAQPGQPPAPPPLPAQAEAVSVIHAGRLLAEPGRPARGPSSIVVRGRTIAEVRDGFAELPGARVIDLRDQYVLPGLIDMHVHMRSSGNQLRQRLEATTANREDGLMAAVRHAALTLQAGFTTVRDLGGDAPMMRALMRGIEEGLIEGPSIVPAMLMISVTGGHGDPANLLREDFAAVERADTRHVCDGPEDCRRATRQQIADGAQVIKFASTGGVLSNVGAGLGRQMTPEEMRAIVETAHLYGRKVTAHAHGKDGIEGALEAGVDSIEHGTFTDDRTMALYKKTGAYYVPTLLAPAAANAAGQRGELPPASAAKAAEAAGNAMKSFANAYRSGVRIAFGTDTGVSPHGRNAEEFALMVEAGMPAAVAIRTATLDAAQLIGRAERIGRIAPGFDADIIAVGGDPAEDVRRLQNVGFVMRQGTVHKAGGARQALASPTQAR